MTRRLLLAIAFVVVGSADIGALDLAVDPHTATLEWEDGRVESVLATNGTFCRGIKAAVDLGYECRVSAKRCGWQPVGRADVRLVKATCARGGSVPGGPCILGYNC